MMGGPAASHEAEIQALREAYAALNRGDAAGFVRGFDPAVVRVELIDPATFPTGSVHRGLAAVTEHVVRGRRTWAEGGCEPERFIAAGDRVVALVHVRVRVKGETGWREGRVGDVFTFRAGRIVEFRTFADATRALEWAGADPAEAR